MEKTNFTTKEEVLQYIKENGCFVIKNNEIHQVPSEIVKVMLVEYSCKKSCLPNKGLNFHNGHEYVDLDLPSGTLWAKCNVGAETETDYGLYFAWGETEGYTGTTPTKKFSWSDYKFNPSGDGRTFTKYNSTDGKTILDAEDDAATVNMGGEWHMPTEAQWDELLSNTTSEWATINGVNGYKFTAANGNYIFIPAAGYCYNGSVRNVGSCGDVWSSLVGSSSLGYAWYLDFDSSSIYADYGGYRRHGFSVRGVVG